MKKAKKKTTYGRVTITQAGKSFRIRWREDNKPRERTSTNYETACKMAQDIDARLEFGRPGNPKSSFAALVAAATERNEFRRYSNDAWGTLRSLARNHIIPAFEDHKASSVKKIDLENFLDKLLLEDQLSKYTVSKIRLIIRRACALGVRLGIWDAATNPAADLRVPQSDTDETNYVQLQQVSEDRIPTEDEVRRLLDVAWKSRPLHGFILELAARSGLRWSEIMGLRPEDFDFDKRVIKVERARRELLDGSVIVKSTKTAAGKRVAVLSKLSVDRVRAFVETQPKNEFICLSMTGNIVRKTNFVKPFRRYKKEAEFPAHLTTHSLRHFFGTYGLRAGVNLVDVSKLMGHANPQTTMTLYVHGDSESVERSKKFL